MWRDRALELEAENRTLRAELDLWKTGYKAALALAKPAPKFEQEPVE